MPRASSDAPARRSSRRAAAEPTASPAKRGATKGKGEETAAPAKGKERAQSKTPARRGGRRTQVEDEEDEEEEQDEEEEEQVEPQGGGNDDDDGSDDGNDAELKMAKVNKMPIAKTAADVAGKLGRAEISNKASDLVRLALFTEYRRAPLRRDEISKKVLGKPAAKAFPVIFNKAQRILRSTFGMELVELRAKGTESQAHLDQTAATQTQTQRGKKRGREASDDEAAEAGKGEKSISSHTYMLRSMLPPAFIETLGSENAALAAAAADTAVADGSTQRDPSGAMLDWKRADAQQGPMGLLMLVLSLILLNGRELPDEQLRANLRRLSLDTDTPLPRALVPHTTTLRSETKLTLQGYLDQLVKQNYLERVRSNATLGGARTAEGVSAGRRALATKKKRSGAEGGNAEDDNFEWRWGARAEVEVGESSVAKFVGEVFHARPAGQEEPEESEEEQEEVAPRRGGRRGAGPSQAQQRRRVSSGQSQRLATQTQQRVVLLKEIERAAGSQLVD